MKANTIIPISTAKSLKQAGLVWSPAEHDFFTIPYQDLDEQVFVISDMSVLVEVMGDEQAITFNGTMEWALDYLVVTEAIWLPSEGQLRTELETRLVERGEDQPVMKLTSTSDGYQCVIRFRGKRLTFDAFGAGEAYAAALLHVLQQGQKP